MTGRGEGGSSGPAGGRAGERRRQFEQAHGLTEPGELDLSEQPPEREGSDEDTDDKATGDKRPDEEPMDDDVASDEESG